jgi:hypothetical protein
MSTESIPSEPGSSALAVQPSNAERRVQLAKARLQAHLVALDHRARELARQSAWIAGVVLLGVAGAAAAATMFGSRKRRRRYYADEPRARGGVGTALVLTALGLLTRRFRAF